MIYGQDKELMRRYRKDTLQLRGSRVYAGLADIGDVNGTMRTREGKIATFESLSYIKDSIALKMYCRFDGAHMSI